MLAYNAARVIVLRYFEEVWNARKLEVIDELLAPAFVGHERNVANVHGPIGVHQVARTFFYNFPDAVFTVVDTVAEGNMVALHLRFHATNRETGCLVQVSGMGFFQLVEGKITEGWSNWDELGMFQQMGGRVVFEKSSL